MARGLRFDRIECSTSTTGKGVAKPKVPKVPTQRETPFVLSLSKHERAAHACSEVPLARTQPTVASKRPVSSTKSSNSSAVFIRGNGISRCTPMAA